MHHEDIQLMEHLATTSLLSLKAFCEVARSALALPAFEYDAENETEWGISVKENVEYNISRPYEAGMLKQWDSTAPDGCNFGIIIIFRRSAIPVARTAPCVEQVGQALATSLNTPVVHHRTWLRSRESHQRNAVYVPQPSDA